MNTDAPTQSTAQGFIPGALAPADPPKSAPGKPVIVHEPTSQAAVPLVAGSPVGDQLARIEDKCSRIEDKYARSEALLTRVEDHIVGAATRLGEAARQSDLAALRTEVRGINDRIRGIPGTGALILTAIITAVLTVILLVAVQRLQLDSYLPQRAAPSAPAAPAAPQP